jgi:hypothetical protein
MLLLHMQIRDYFNKICDNKYHRVQRSKGNLQIIDTTTSPHNKVKLYVIRVTKSRSIYIC